MKPKERKCYKCGTHYYYQIRYNGVSRYCHKCYLERRRIYEKKRNNKRNAVFNYVLDIDWPHVNKSANYITGMFGLYGNIQRQSTDSKHKKP